MNAEIDISNVHITTPRLLLRPWRAEDLDDFYAYASVDGVGQMAGWKPHETREESARILQSFIEQKKTFALEHKGQVIGSLGIERYDESRFPELAPLRCRELGYVLSKEYWGRALMPEAVAAVIRYLFEDIQLDALLCGHFLHNPQSARVQAKCGFHPYATGLYKTQMGTTEQEQVNILYRTEWQQLSK